MVKSRSSISWVCGKLDNSTDANLQIVWPHLWFRFWTTKTVELRRYFYSINLNTNSDRYVSLMISNACHCLHETGVKTISDRSNSSSRSSSCFSRVVLCRSVPWNLGLRNSLCGEEMVCFFLLLQSSSIFQSDISSVFSTIHRIWHMFSFYAGSESKLLLDAGQ